MNAQMPPFFWASESRWYSSVVLPDDSGPNTSTIRPRGMPPTPSARSSDSAPVEMASTRTLASSSPMRMIEPLPNWRSIWESAPFRAASRAFAAFSCSLSIKPCSSKSWDRKAKGGRGRIRPLAGVYRPTGMPQSSSEQGNVSDQLEGWLKSDGDKTVSSLIELFEEKSFAILFVLLLGVSALPLPTGG